MNDDKLLVFSWTANSITHHPRAISYQAMPYQATIDFYRSILYHNSFVSSFVVVTDFFVLFLNIGPDQLCKIQC